MLRQETVVALKGLIASILRDEAPEEVEVFELVGEDAVKQVMRPTGRGKAKADGGFEFGPGLEAGTLVLHLIAGTLAVVGAVIESRRIRAERMAEETIRAIWEKFLTQRGLDAETARRIPVKFSGDLAGLLEHVKDEEGHELTS